jgi:hypothetical protein
MWCCWFTGTWLPDDMIYLLSLLFSAAVGWVLSDRVESHQIFEAKGAASSRYGPENAILDSSRSRSWCQLEVGRKENRGKALRTLVFGCLITGQTISKFCSHSVSELSSVSFWKGITAGLVQC